MSVTPILIISGIILYLAYRWYGYFVSKWLKINDSRQTPAHTKHDDIDYIPTNRFVVLGHHFASIAGAGPIVGPVIAVTFGWIPALIWILLGGIFFGSIQDITSLVASIRHEGKSIGEIIHHYIGDWGKKLFLVFAFATLILVIAVFADIVAKTFVSVPEAASASSLFMLLAIAFGLILKRSKLRLSWIAFPAVIAMFMTIYLGSVVPFELGYWSWIAILMVYIYISSVAPVWLILQPRDFLNSFLLYGMMIAGISGLIWMNPAIEMTSAIFVHDASLGYLFPVLFVTIACGAISGFHSLVASGTSSKQLDRETDAQFIGMGGMLTESFLAVMALCTVIVVNREEYVSLLADAGPVSAFSSGLGQAIAQLGIPVENAISFVALTVSAFALTSLDTCTRLARYVLQEFFEFQSEKSTSFIGGNRYLATIVPVVASLGLIMSGGFAELWPIFGSANQLLGALALLAVTVWLTRMKVNSWFTFIPMVFMFIVTLTSLLIFVKQNFENHNYLLALIALFLFGLAVVLLVLARNSLRTFKND